MDIRKRALHSAVLTAVLAVSIFLGTGEVDGLVLCLGHCGHVEVEESSHTSCNDTCAPADSPQPGDTPEHHDHCVDLPLGGQRADLPLDSSVQNLPRPCAVLGAVIGEGAPTCAGDFLNAIVAQVPLPSLQLTALRTVILLT